MNKRKNMNFRTARGKMSEEELSEVWRQLLENEIDVLICTTIIETGVDVPNANTLIIENADKMQEGSRNAMLKILEEPPEHVVFILATTELHKIPATVLSSSSPKVS